MENPGFDASRPITINLRTPSGVKTVRVRFPSDDEWIARQRRCKVLVKQLGRGISETTVANGEDVDAALVALIQEKPRDGDAPEIDPFEAMKVVEQLSLAEVDDVVPDGDLFKVTLRVLGATTLHLLKMPSAKDVFEYRRGFARLLDTPFWPTGSDHQYRVRRGALQETRHHDRGVRGRSAPRPRIAGYRSNSGSVRSQG